LYVTYIMMRRASDDDHLLSSSFCEG